MKYKKGRKIKAVIYCGGVGSVSGKGVSIYEKYSWVCSSCNKEYQTQKGAMYCCEDTTASREAKRDGYLNQMLIGMWGEPLPTALDPDYVETRIWYVYTLKTTIPDEIVQQRLKERGSSTSSSSSGGSILANDMEEALKLIYEKHKNTFESEDGVYTIVVGLRAKEECKLNHKWVNDEYDEELLMCFVCGKKKFKEVD